jgi:hypothetical protein
VAAAVRTTINAPVATSLAVKPVTVAIALIVFEEESEIGTVYFVEPVVGVLPSVV